MGLRLLAALFLLAPWVLSCGVDSRNVDSESAPSVIEGDILVPGAARRRALGHATARWMDTRWPDRRVPYVLEPALSDPTRVQRAFDEYHRRSAFRFVPRGEEPDYVVLRAAPFGACRSAVGRVGGAQDVFLGEGCSAATAMHELGHVLGLWHEHTRADRDRYLRILWDNVTPGAELDFQESPGATLDLGPYDYRSIMHYPSSAFSRNGQPTMVKPDGSPRGFGDATAPSDGDLAALETIYAYVPPAPVPPAAPTVPPNRPPAWSESPVRLGAGRIGRSYQLRLAGRCQDPDGNPLAFRKLSGPKWLRVRADGLVHGTVPAAAKPGAFTASLHCADGESGAAVTAQGRLLR